MKIEKFIILDGVLSSAQVYSILMTLAIIMVGNVCIKLVVNDKFVESHEKVIPLAVGTMIAHY